MRFKPLGLSSQSQDYIFLDPPVLSEARNGLDIIQEGLLEEQSKRLYNR